MLENGEFVFQTALFYDNGAAQNKFNGARHGGTLKRAVSSLPGINGYTITAADSSRLFSILGKSFTLCDCNSSKNGQGKLTGGYVTKSASGGGVRVSGGTFNMYGGEISGNTASAYGGGIRIDYNGSAAAEVTLNGKVKIAGNTGKSNCNNVVIYNSIIKIGEIFSIDSPIGVSYYEFNTYSAPKNILKGDVITEDIISCFTADMDTNYLQWDSANNRVQLERVHINAQRPSCGGFSRATLVAR